MVTYALVIWACVAGACGYDDRPTYHHLAERACRVELRARLAELAWPRVEEVELTALRLDCVPEERR